MAPEAETEPLRKERGLFFYEGGGGGFRPDSAGP